MRPTGSLPRLFLFLSLIGSGSAATNLTISATPNPSVFGAPIHLTGAPQGCTPPAGARVTFYDGVTVLGSGTFGAAPFSTTLPAGIRKLRAYYSGDALCAAGSSPTWTQTVKAVASTYFNFTGNTPVADTPSSVATGDFNGDGKADVAVANAHGVRILTGNGSGGFLVAGDYAAGNRATGLALGDFNRDGVTDVAFTTGAAIGILIGNGDGSFQAPQMYTPASGAATVAAADFNGDGAVDLAYTGGSVIGVLFGNGDGSFRAPAALIGANSPGAIAVADFNGDGVADLAVLGNSPANSVSMYLGAGDGTFISVAGYATGETPVAISAADLNGDGRPDLAVVNLRSATVSIFLGKGDGTLQMPVAYNAGTPLPNSLSIGDFNGDGMADLAITDGDFNYQSVAILLGNGNGSFQAASLSGGGNVPVATAIADFNGDGRADIVVADDHSTSVGILLGVSATLARSGTPQSTVAGSAFGVPLRLVITDSTGNPMSGVLVRFTAPSSGASAALSATVASTDAAGSVSVTATANGATGTYSVTAQALNQTVSYALTNTAAASSTPPPPSSSPVTGAAGAWTFDAADTTGSQTLDSSGNGLTGTTSGVASIAGVVNQAFTFSGAGSSVAVPDYSGLQLTHDLSLAAWIRTTNNSQIQNFIGKYDYTGAESGYLLQVLPSGGLNLHIGGNNLAAGSRNASDGTPVNDGQWHHVAVVVTLGQNVAFYVDGRLSSTQPQVAMASSSNPALYLGTSPGAYYGQPFVGALDEVRIYAKALAAADVAALAHP